MSYSQSLPDINRPTIPFREMVNLSNINLTIHEKTVKQIATITREMGQEVFGSMETIYHPDQSRKLNVTSRQASSMLDKIKENVIDEDFKPKSNLLNNISMSCDHLDTIHDTLQVPLTRSTQSHNDLHSQTFSNSDHSESIVSCEPEIDHSVSISDSNNYSNYRQSYGVRLATSIQTYPEFYHVSSSSLSAMYICEMSTSPTSSSTSTSYLSAYSDLSKTSIGSENLEVDNETFFCHFNNKESKLGFSIVGSQPVRVDSVKYGSLGYQSGLQTGDIIRKVNGFDVRYCSHSLVAKLIKNNSEINLHLQREKRTIFKKAKTKTVSDKNIKFATILSHLIFNDECVELMEDTVYVPPKHTNISINEEPIKPETRKAIDLSGSNIIKAQFALCNSMLKRKDNENYSENSIIYMMSGLPPTGHNHKVAVRNKTSFKRPMSCDVTEKKENKGIFSKLKKGSSNSRLDEESQYQETTEDFNKPNNNNFNDKKENISIMRVQGRNFDSDDDDYLLDSGDTVVTKMEKLFNSYDKVLKNPVLFGLALKYLILHNLDYYSMLFYLVVQHYKSTIQSKEFAKEALRFVVEIYTTFLHEKSVLKINHPDTKPIVVEDLKTAKDFQTVFDESSNFVFKNCITCGIDKVKTSIAHGLFTVECNVDAMSFEEKLAYFNGIIKFIMKNLDEKVQREHDQNVTKETKDRELFLQDVASGVKSSLATIYFYFSKRDKEENADNMSIVSLKINSFLGKSTENLQLMTNCFLEKSPMFCSKMHKKQGSHSFFKKAKVVKGHSFQEKHFEHAVECVLCNRVLWGIGPQGFLCSNCQAAAHKNCKDFVRIICQRDMRKVTRNSLNPNVPAEDDINKISAVEDHCGTKEIGKVNDIVKCKDILDGHDESKIEEWTKSIDCESHNSEDGMQMSTTSASSDLSQSVTPIPTTIVSTATIVVTGSNEEKSPESVFDNVSVASLPDINQFDSVKTENEKFDLPIIPEKKMSYSSHIPRGHVRSLADKIDKRGMFSRMPSEGSIDNTSLNSKIGRTGFESVHVQDLIQDTELWSNDDDMKVGETFEADKELESFPDHVSKDQDKAEYTRLLVLMEFHHKTKFTVMTLKRFDYLLIKPWPADELFLFKTLSLNCIVPLYELIKKLVNTIESCRMNSTFNEETAKNVYDWLVSNEETNLQKWLKYSIDLCCTNSLLLVKNTWKEFKKSDPRFAAVLGKRYNKMMMVEHLSNMRPLLFNFPLIVNKLWRDLSKFPKFKEEVKIWKQVHDKFKQLPTFIDEHCMPLVQLINSGTIINGSDRSGWIGKLNQANPCYDYIIDFPKTAFHYKLFDFQEIRISNFRESGNKTPAVFVKEVCDAYAICYENILVFLQKENEKYVLKQFKSITGSVKFNPILILENVHPSKGVKKDEYYELTVIFINVAVMTQIFFMKKDARERWNNFLNMLKMKNPNPKKLKIFENRHNHDEKEDMDGFDSLAVNDPRTDGGVGIGGVGARDGSGSRRIVGGINNNDDDKSSQYDTEELIDKCNNVKDHIDEYLFYINSLKLDGINDNVICSKPNNCFDILIGTTHDAGKIFKMCSDSLNQSQDSSSQNFVSDEVFDQVFSHLSAMQNRIIYYKNNRDKDSMSLNDIDCAISDANEPGSESVEVTPPESVTEDHSEENSFPSTLHTPVPDSSDHTNLHNTYLEFDLKEEYYRSDEFKCFVDKYVHNLIEDAQRYIIQHFESGGNLDVDTIGQDS